MRAAHGAHVAAVTRERREESRRLANAAITDDGAIWVVHPKGPTGIADTAIFAKAKELGLIATKVARVSDTLTAEKLVRPLASRRSAKPVKSNGPRASK